MEKALCGKDVSCASCFILMVYKSRSCLFIWSAIGVNVSLLLCYAVQMAPTGYQNSMPAISQRGLEQPRSNYVWDMAKGTFGVHRALTIRYLLCS